LYTLEILTLINLAWVTPSKLFVKNMLLNFFKRSKQSKEKMIYTTYNDYCLFGNS
jgi:hypothetical protein